MPRRFLPKLEKNVLPDERYHVPPRLGRADADVRLRAEIFDGAFRPADAKQRAELDPAVALLLPFWRVDLERTVDSLRLSQVRIGEIGIPIPHQHSRTTRATLMVCARTAFPYEPKHRSTILAQPLKVDLAALAPGDLPPGRDWELVDADVDADRARALAARGLGRGALQPSRTLFSETEHTVHAIHFVRLPIWFVRYRYRGEASGERDGDFYVGISAVDGAPFTVKHPSKLRAVLGIL